ncbi:hypothetical protein [Streptomyces sp. NPDC055749]
MRFTPAASLALTAGACTVLLLAGQPAVAGSGTAAHKAAAAAPTCVKDGETGTYLSKEGTSKATFSSGFFDTLRRAGVTMDAIAPHEMTDNGTSVTLPIGEKYDNIEFPSGRVCYPGGFRYTKEATGKTSEIDIFWVQFAAFGNSKFLATPKVDGKPLPTGELTMLNFSVPQAFTTGEFVPHNDGIGPKRVVMSMDAQWATHLNTELGTDFRAGQHVFDLDIAWKGLPTKPFPNTGPFPSPGVAGLQSIADAIRPELSPTA